MVPLTKRVDSTTDRGFTQMAPKDCPRKWRQKRGAALRPLLVWFVRLVALAAVPQRCLEVAVVPSQVARAAVVGRLEHRRAQVRAPDAGDETDHDHQRAEERCLRRDGTGVGELR